MRKKYVLSTYISTYLNAGPKAKKDVEKILNQTHDFKLLFVNMYNKNKLEKLISILKKIYLVKIKCKKGDIVITQEPFLGRYYFTSNLKNHIALIHDIEGLRNNSSKKLQREIKIYDSCKYIISHNQSMTNFLIKKGIDRNKIINLDLFDYLASDKIKEEYSFNKNDIKLIYPGNLSKEKSPFIYQLDSNKLNFKINLYGIGIDKDISDKLIYKGSFEPDEINDLEGDIGLIWDGNYDESDEDIWYKNYTKYNNPHKLSCCMAMGIPVIVWEKAAIADFVKKNNVGYTIRNIYDINNLDFDNYDIKRKNAIRIGKMVREGYYTKQAIEKIIKKI